MPHPQIVGAVQHTAVRVPPAVDHVAVALGGSHIHHWALELLTQQGLRGLGAKIAQKHHQGVDAVGAHILQRRQRIFLVLHRHGALVDVLSIGRHDLAPPPGGQRDGETVP